MHEPKGVAAAVANRVYLSNGSGSGSWTVIPGAALSTSLTTPGSLKSTSPTAGIGFATGAGGAVTQITSITTAVTLNTMCGTVTTVSATTGPGVEDSFSVINSNVAATDVVVLSVNNYAGAGSPLVYCLKVVAGAFSVTISNLHAANALNAPLIINFAIIKSVNA